jgi:hypothetical protein
MVGTETKKESRSGVVTLQNFNEARHALARSAVGIYVNLERELHGG